MTDDAYLNGYARICGIYATGVYMSLCRHVNKQQTCFPGIDHIAEELNISRPSVIKGIKALEDQSIILVIRSKRKDGKQLPNEYALIDKSLWKPKAESTTFTREAESTTLQSRVNEIYSAESTRLTVRKHKEKVTQKQQYASQNDARLIESVIESFKGISPTETPRWYGNKTQRGAADRLISVYGFDHVQKVIALLPKTNKIPYFPSINSPDQLSKKWKQLEAAFERKKTESKLKSNVAFA